MFGLTNNNNSTTIEKEEVKDDIPFTVGDVVEGEIVAIDRSTVYIDLPPVGTGIIYGREFLIAKDILRKAKVGDAISAKIIGFETENGYIDLSLREARKALIWSEVEDAKETGRIYDVVPKSANRGGLIIEWNGVRGFLPSSQLSEENYPKVLNADKDAILNELKKLVGQKLSVKIIDMNQDEDHIIFSEHAQKTERLETESVDKIKYKIGDTKTGVITGIVDFGIFVKIDNKLEGLVHISEIDWGLVDNPRRFHSVGDHIKVKITDIQDEKYSLSIKALKTNPWNKAKEKYKAGDTVSGVVIKYSEHGAFASIEAGVSGLAHISHFKDEEDLRHSLELGKTYEFVITLFDPVEQKLTIVPKDRYKEK